MVLAFFKRIDVVDLHSVCTIIKTAFILVVYTHMEKTNSLLQAATNKEEFSWTFSTCCA